VFFVTENYFVAMVIVSFALLVYVTGSELAKLFLTSFTIFFSSKHVIPAPRTCRRRSCRCAGR